MRKMLVLLALASMATLRVAPATPGGPLSGGRPDPLAALVLAAHARGASPETVGIPASAGIGPSLERFSRTVLGERAVPADVAALGTLSPSYQRGLVRLLDAMSFAQDLRRRAYAGISPEEIAATAGTALRAQTDPGSVRPADAARAASVISRIDMGAMLTAASTLQQAAADARRFFAVEEAPEEPVETSFDAIVVGTAGDDTYARDKQLVIEPGGNDTYLNNAGGVRSSQAFDTTGGCVAGGGSTGKGSPNLECTPLPSQVCTYDTLNRAAGTNALPVVGVPNHDPPGTDDSRDGSCGSDERRRALGAHTADIGNDGDSRAVGVVLDLAGSDTYTAPWSYEDPLFDLIGFCFPDDHSKTNTNRDYFQAGTLAGISLLWDDGPGDNTFRGRLNTQGSGHVGGVGMLLSTGGGDDHYWADRLAQGNGIAGGVGVLVDTGGTNTFLLEPPVVYRNEFRPSGRECSQQGRAGQGQGGFAGVGVLWNAGEATYRAVVHATDDVAPFTAILDAEGRPMLLRGSDAQGSGESFPISGTPGGIVAGVGILVQQGGDARVCPGAGKLEGADHLTRAPGAVDEACGTFNLDPELSAADLDTALVHLSGGAVGIRVVIP